MCFSLLRAYVLGSDGLSLIPSIRSTMIHTLLRFWGDAGLRDHQGAATLEAGAKPLLPLLESGHSHPIPSPQAFMPLVTRDFA